MAANVLQSPVSSFAKHWHLREKSLSAATFVAWMA
jgi:hypothetical protein